MKFPVFLVGFPFSTPPEKSRKGFGYHVRQVKARPDGMAVRDLLSDEKIHEGGVKVFESYYEFSEVKALALGTDCI